LSFFNNAGINCTYDYSNQISIGSINVANPNKPSGSGTLNVKIVFSYNCNPGEELCSGSNLLKCEVISQEFNKWKEIWTADVNRWVSKGEVLGKCGVVEPCTEDWTTGDWGECN